jgi:ferrous iron transport protein B
VKPAKVATVALDKVVATLPATSLIAVVGNPNSGKSTLFNKLTGLRQKTANFPGVTVEKHSGVMASSGHAIELIDLPGTFSLNVHSADEQVAVDVLLGRVPGMRQPDAVLLVIDETRLYQGLFLAEQVLDLNVPVVVALTMHDAAIAAGIRVDVERLSRHLCGAPVYPVVAMTGAGIPALKECLAHARELTRQTGAGYWPELRDAALRLREALGESAESLPLFEAERVLIDGELASFSRRHGLDAGFVASHLDRIWSSLFRSHRAGVPVSAPG